MVTIVFESHGTTFDNEKDLSSGHFDAQLSQLGERQARELGERYAAEHFGAIFCSDRERAWRTGEIAFAGRNIPIIKDARLRECDYGDLTRHPGKEIERVKGEYVTTPYPNGESYEQRAAFMKSFLEELLQRYNGKRVMIIGHRATQYGLEHWIKGVPLYDAVVAHWKWQPGWTYILKTLPS